MKIDYSKFSDAFIEQVRAVVAEANTKTYSVSRIYTAYNKAFDKSDTPESCASCLATRANELRIWLTGLDNGVADSYAPGADVVPISLKGDDVLDLHFMPKGDNPEKGTVVYADGQSVKPGTYETLIDGITVTVQPGGKATIKSAAVKEDKPLTGRKAVAAKAAAETTEEVIAAVNPDLEGAATTEGDNATITEAPKDGEEESIL